MGAAESPTVSSRGGFVASCAAQDKNSYSDFVIAIFLCCLLKKKQLWFFSVRESSVNICCVNI